MAEFARKIQPHRVSDDRAFFLRGFFFFFAPPEQKKGTNPRSCPLSGSEAQQEKEKLEKRKNAIGIPYTILSGVREYR